MINGYGKHGILRGNVVQEGGYGDLIYLEIKASFLCNVTLNVAEIQRMCDKGKDSIC